MSEPRNPEQTLATAKGAFWTIATLTLLGCAPALIFGVWKWALAL